MKPNTTHPDFDSAVPSWSRARAVLADEDAVASRPLRNIFILSLCAPATRHIKTAGLRMRVCVVTQDESISALVRDALKPAAVEVVSSGDQLLPCITAENREKPAFIVIDLTSTTNGLRTLQFIKSSPSVSHLKVIIIAHLGQTDHAIEASGADALLRFPFSASELADLVTRISQYGPSQ